jgi:hypothetical protein
MPTPSWDNLDAFLDPADFAGSVLLQLADGSSRTVQAIFDEPYLNAQLGEYEPDTTQPRITAKAIDLAGLARGDLATVDGTTYDVMGAPQPDGTGMAVLPLAARE